MEIKQNVQLTFKYNTALGRHGWLRLTPAYSVKMVEKILLSLNYSPKCVFEPFSGTGTTELVCANQGIASIAYDINPFLVWLAKTKCNIYSPETIEHFKIEAQYIVDNIECFSPYTYPPIHNIDRWWSHEQLNYIARIKTAIWNEKEEEVSDLLKIAFCRLLISLSKASFNHVSTSFSDKEDSQKFSDSEGSMLFLSYCNMIVDTVEDQPKARTVIKQQNSIFEPSDMYNKYDILITSPPYPNRISYIRELRPYMYWLDYISTPNDASDLDWNTIGGTWGSATSKLSSWEKKTELLPDYLFDITDKISKADNKSAKLMSNYVLKYFDDIAMHMQFVYNTIMDGGSVHYIVGNSSFYGNIVPSDRIYKDILSEIGFKNTKSEIVRKRNCNKALYEYWISAEK